MSSLRKFSTESSQESPSYNKEYTLPRCRYLFNDAASNFDYRALNDWMMAIKRKRCEMKQS